MLMVFWLVLFLVGASLILFMPAIWGAQTYKAYRHPRPVDCPANHQRVAVRFDALRAAITGLAGPPSLRLRDCTRWPEMKDCGQECINDAMRNAPDAPIATAEGDGAKIFHLPILVAAAVAWVFGMVWHSEYLFRAKWMAAIGLTDRQTRTLAEMWAPHLLSIGACLLFAYGVGCTMAWLQTRSALMGVRVAVSLWLVIAGSLLALTRTAVSSDLLQIDGWYTLIAAILIGAITGGLPNRVFIRDHS